MLKTSEYFIERFQTYRGIGGQQRSGKFKGIGKCIDISYRVGFDDVCQQ